MRIALALGQVAGKPTNATRHFHEGFVRRRLPCLLKIVLDDLALRDTTTPREIAQPLGQLCWQANRKRITHLAIVYFGSDRDCNSGPALRSRVQSCKPSAL